MGMSNLKPEFYFLLVALIATAVLAFFIFKPFLFALVLAVVFAVAFRPLYEKIITYSHVPSGVSALASMLVVVIFIFAPLTLLGVQVVQEAGGLYSSLTEKGGADGLSGLLDGGLNKLKEIFPALQGITINTDQYAKQGLTWVVEHLGSIFSDFAKIMMSLFIFLVALYYLLKDGEKIKKFIIELSPLRDRSDELIFKKLEDSANSILKGNLLVALTQGVLTAFGFWIFGVPNAVLWGSVAVITAIIPGVGTALVLAPAIAFLFLSGATAAGFGLLAWGVGAVGLVDNFLGPKLVGKGMQLHPLIVLLSALGGIAFFGPIGLLMGPLTVSFLFALLEVHFSLAKERKG